MGSFGIDALKNKGTYTVGQVNSWNMETVINGALVTETNGVENFKLVKLGFNDDGERTCAYPTASTDVCVLTVTPEQRLEGEPLANFYNAKGDRATLAYLPVGFTFETSGFTLATAVGSSGSETTTAVTEVKAGLVAHFDATTKAYIISNADKPHAGYATAGNQFLVVGFEDEDVYTISNAQMVQLEVTK